jgi:uncharacterized protein (TIRG00374 family)
MRVSLFSAKERSCSAIVMPIVLILFVVGSGLLLVYLLRDMDWELVRRAGPGALALILVTTVAATFLYVLLVYVLIRGSGHTTTLWRAYLVLTASLSANYFTPLKVGIPLRIYLYHHFMAVPIATGTALVAMEALIGMLVPAVVAAVGIAYLFPSVGWGTPVVLIALLASGLFLLLRVRAERLGPRVKRLPLARLSTRLISFVERVQAAARCLSLATLSAVLALDLLMLALQSVRLWIVLRAFGPAPSPLSLLAVFTISVTAGNLSMIPMGLGVRDASFTLLLAQLGVSQEIALSAAVIQRLFSPGWPLLLGLISANILGVSELAKEHEGPVPAREDTSYV